MNIVFWASLVALIYIFIGYPALLAVAALFRGRGRPSAGASKPPSVSMIIPVHNEIGVIEQKLRNTVELEYDRELLQVIVISDASTDGTDDVAARFADEGAVQFRRQPERQGKGAALNLGLELAEGEIVVFSDASIFLEPEALSNIVRPFASPGIGCVSGEDYIREGGGEGMYGRYELFLRNLESRVCSIVGASGCFYAQRKELCRPFAEGMAPDFLSVLHTVAGGYRAVTEPSARGEMRAVRTAGQEFPRKVRTMLRGMTTLSSFKRLLDPLRHGFFAVELLSHKVLRWLAGLFLATLAIGNVALAASAPFRWFLLLQVVCYFAALVGWLGPRRLAGAPFFRIPFFFCMVNLAGLVAWGRFLVGYRQEIWEPSQR
jgi:cellulose synthase/poly-beta-1,6-N-acetylglucosamine synthase-like glycosyltransferase